MRLVNLMLDGRDEASVIREAERLARQLEHEKGSAEGVDLLGPAPQPMSRLKGKHRWHVTLRGRDHKLLRALAEKALIMAEGASGQVRLAVDVDPASLL